MKCFAHKPGALVLEQWTREMSWWHSNLFNAPSAGVGRELHTLDYKHLKQWKFCVDFPVDDSLPVLPSILFYLFYWLMPVPQPVCQSLTQPVPTGTLEGWHSSEVNREGGECAQGCGNRRADSPPLQSVERGTDWLQSTSLCTVSSRRTTALAYSESLTLIPTNDVRIRRSVRCSKVIVASLYSCSIRTVHCHTRCSPAPVIQFIHEDTWCEMRQCSEEYSHAWTLAGASGFSPCNCCLRCMWSTCRRTAVMKWGPRSNCGKSDRSTGSRIHLPQVSTWVYFSTECVYFCFPKRKMHLKKQKQTSSYW